MLPQEEGRLPSTQLLPRAVFVGRSSLYSTNVCVLLLFIRMGLGGTFVVVVAGSGGGGGGSDVCVLHSGFNHAKV